MYKYSPRNHRKSYRWFRKYSESKLGSMITPEGFRHIKKLYHYTSFNTGLIILLSKMLRMSPLSNMNDINESYRMLYSSGCDISDVESEMKRYFQSSFTIDDDFLPGFALPAMWGHYADKGKGVCLVFDMHKLLKRFRQEIFFHGAISYYDGPYDASIIVEDNPQEYCIKHYQNIFFSKSADWAYEREYRLVCRSEDDLVEIDISDCIIAIVVNQFDDISRYDTFLNSPRYRSLVCQAKKQEIPVLVLGNRILSSNITLTDGYGNNWYAADKEIKYKLVI